ncbi:MAG: hypothetical protein H0W90_16185 [Actinobacteria bacterium]|nr:hypothetical protein [Actinomycetota bacterium]
MVRLFVITALALAAASASGAASVRGTDKNDTLVGTPANDVIHGYGGDDNIYGGAGNDRLFGGPGKDHIFAGAGDDLVIGGPAVDPAKSTPVTRHERIFGGGGNDRIEVHVAGAIIDAGPGDDRIDIRDPADDCHIRHGARQLADPPHCIDRVGTGTGNDIVRADDNNLDLVFCQGPDLVIADSYDYVSPACTVRRVKR